MGNLDHDDVDSSLVDEFEAGLIDGCVISLQEFLKDQIDRPNRATIIAMVYREIHFRRSRGEPVSLQDMLVELPELEGIEEELTITRDRLQETTSAATEIDVVDQRQPKRRELLKAGDSIDDFDLLTELGRGSFATVFLARQKSMQRLVALKISADHGMEAQTLAQLDHPHIVRVYDLRRAEKHDLQLLYMQYLEGGSLLDVLRQVLDTPADELSGKNFVECVDQAITEHGYSPSYQATLRQIFQNSDWEQTVCRIGYHLATALDYAHRKGVLHRDIKPANVLIGSDYSVKLADFNISAAETVVGEFKFGGSLAYMSPEQIRAFNNDDPFSADQLTAQSDIYSLGVMLFQLLRRELPFYAMSKSRSAEGLSTMIAEREHSVERLRSSLKVHSPLLRNALARCLQPEAVHRPESAGELANQFKIGLDHDAENFLFPTRRNWTRFFQKYFYVVCIAVNWLFNALAAVFVYNFNLFDSVPEESQDVFWRTQAGINGVAFPLAMIVFVWLTISVPKALRLCLAGKQKQVPNMKLAMDRTLYSGHIQAVICGSLWLAAGFLYPILLSSFGCELESSDWIDFIASHTLAGVSITALTFFATTYLALRIWLPVLLQNSFSDTAIATVTSGLDGLIRKIPIYQLLAVSVPLLAMTLLVIFGEVMTRSKFPLTVISIFGFITIPIVLFGGNRIRSVCERLLVVFRAS